MWLQTTQFCPKIKKYNIKTMRTITYILTPQLKNYNLSFNFKYDFKALKL